MSKAVISWMMRIALVLVLGLTPAAARPAVPEQIADEPVEFSAGIRGRLGDGNLRKARLVFTEDLVIVEVRGEAPERFTYGELAVRRGRHHLGVPLFDSFFWWSVLPSVALIVATGGVSQAAYQVGGMLAGGHSVYLLRKLRSPYWLSLHASQRDHRCAFLRLPRNKTLRSAISEELVRRAPLKFSERPPSGSASGPLPVPGAMAPDFDLPDLDGSRVRLSDLRGQVVVLNFWATWCGPCRKELPQLQRLHEKYANDGLVVLGVSDEKPNVTREFLAEREISYLALHDEAGRVFQRYGVMAIPTTVVIGRDGIISSRLRGYTGAAAMTKAVKNLFRTPVGLKRR